VSRIARVELITGNTPASATSAQVGAIVRGLRKYDWFTIDAILVGPTGGTLDLTLQRKIGDLPDGTAVDLWVDWLRFPQVGAATTARYSAQSGEFYGLTGITATGMVAAATFTVTLATNTFIGGHPGDQLRAVCTTGAGTSAAGAENIYITAWNKIT
jgi:hypothetical protein